MKKIYLCFMALAITTLSFGQSQRLVLFEEFTGETCPPCASTNPGLNALLNANQTKVVSIKYMNDIPSPGPRFYAYNTPDVEARQTFYANNYSPNGILDGNVYNDQPATLTQTIIDNRYAVTSSFSVTVTHSFSAANDSIFASATITATQAVNLSTLKAHMVVIERNVYGYTAPNGENHFEGVMRKMLPTNAGTVLQTVWNAGDAITIDVAWKIAPAAQSSPQYIQLGVVGFVQNTANKEVLQAGYSRPQIPLDPLAAALDLDAITCAAGAISPDFEVFNNGVQTLTSFDVNYRIDAGTWNTYNWTGSLAPLASTTITLPALGTTVGSHTYSVAIVNPNGGIDLDMNNNNLTKLFGVPAAPVATNVAESFLVTTFPPTNWIRVNPDNGPTWTRVTTGAAGTTGSAKIDFYNSTAGNEDDLYVFPIDMSSATNAVLTFDLAHKRYSAAYFDRLKVMVSTDCGQTWATPYNVVDPALATVTGYTTAAYSPLATDWRNETVNLAAYVGQPNVLVLFRAVSGYGNNAYVDNININLTLGVNENNALSKEVSLYPNPSSGKFYLDMNFNSSKDVNVEIYDVAGKQISTMEYNNIVGGMYSVDLSNEANGLYTVKISTGTEITVKQVNILK